tara:strand:+ start:3106 stop:3495 length:390 start_codon:yes stop_codon:yes gene_type:complete
MKRLIKIPSNRNFGITFFFVFIILYYIFFDNTNVSNFIFLPLSILFLFLGLINSSFLTPFNKIWNRFGLLLSYIVTPIIITIIYYVIVVPIGLALQLFSKNYLDIKKDSKKYSYWISKTDEKFSFKDQF